MTLKISGRSITKEFVHCWNCSKKMVWCNAYPRDKTKGIYVALCAECRKLENIKTLKKRSKWPGFIATLKSGKKVRIRFV
jgi:peptide methionine sulfoxide reductase MsrB